MESDSSKLTKFWGVAQAFMLWVCLSIAGAFGAHMTMPNLVGFTRMWIAAMAMLVVTLSVFDVVLGSDTEEEHGI